MFLFCFIYFTLFFKFLFGARGPYILAHVKPILQALKGLVSAAMDRAQTGCWSTPLHGHLSSHARILLHSPSLWCHFRPPTDPTCMTTVPVPTHQQGSSPARKSQAPYEPMVEPATANLLPNMKDHACSLPTCTSFMPSRTAAVKSRVNRSTATSHLQHCSPVFQLQTTATSGTLHVSTSLTCSSPMVFSLLQRIIAKLTFPRLHQQLQLPCLPTC